MADQSNLDESVSPLMRSTTLNRNTIFTKEQFKGITNLFKSLPDYHPIARDKSEILNKGQMLVLSYHLPAVIRLQNWQLLFSLSRDGYSHHTFFEKLEDNEETILVV